MISVVVERKSAFEQHLWTFICSIHYRQNTSVMKLFCRSYIFGKRATEVGEYQEVSEKIYPRKKTIPADVVQEAKNLVCEEIQKLEL
mgnify:CR=1 FL=1